MTKETLIQIFKHPAAITFAGSTPLEITQTDSFLRSLSFAALPEDYHFFLELSNGLVCNGVELMGSIPHQRTVKQYIFPDIIQINKPYAKYDYFKEKLIIGRLPEGLLVYQNENRSYAVIDRINLRSRYEAPSLKELLIYIFKLSPSDA